MQNFKILHETKTRLRIKVAGFKGLDASAFCKSVAKLKGVQDVRFNAKIGSLIVKFNGGGKKKEFLSGLENFNLSDFRPAFSRSKSSMPSKNEFVLALFALGANLIFRTSPFVRALSLIACTPILRQGAKETLRHGLTSKTLEAMAVGISLSRGDAFAANSTNAMLALGEYMEESTVYKSDDLIRELARPDIVEAWVEIDQNGKKTEVKIATSKLKVGDIVVVGAGDVIAVDGHVVSGEAMINQANMTGESVAVKKSRGDSVLSGTIVEEGRIRIWAENVGENTSTQRIKHYITASLNERSSIGMHTTHLADKLVPVTFGLAGVSYLINRNFMNVASVLQADYSCALKLPTPVAFKSSISKAGKNGILIKGAKALESLASADTFVFDKTGTLTYGNLEVAEIISFDERFSKNDILNLTASAEEHYFHPVAEAIVDAAKKHGFIHMHHDEVEFVVAHGVKTSIEGKKLIIGSRHFLEDDEMISFAAHEETIDLAMQKGLALLYIAFDGRLLGVIGLRDEVRANARAVIARLRELGVKQIVMLSGDVKSKARAVAKKLGVDRYYGELLPTQKTEILEQLKAEGRKVVFVGDGINDAPSLMKADIGISMLNGAEIAKASAQIGLLKNDIEGVAQVKALANDTLRLVNRNFNATVGINSIILFLATFGVLSPVATALLHNGTTIGLLLNSIKGVKFEN